MKKGLIIQRFWLDKIFDEGKTWEMRTTKTKIRGKILLIEAGSGLIMGEAELMSCSDKPIERHAYQVKFHQVESAELLKKWKYAWVLAFIKRYEEPVPYKHPQGAVIWVNL